MRQSQLFTKTRREVPKDETSKNAQLLIRAGYIHKEMAGVYSYLPLGLGVLKNIEQIIRIALNAVGAQEVFMTTLQDPEIWKATNRWDDKIVDNWFKTKLKNDTEIGLATTHEEPLVRILKDHISSYKDLITETQLSIYQFQTKFRNELRSKSGIMRGREFMMKDQYSFHLSEKSFDNYYEMMARTYLSIFDKVGLGSVTVRTKASGGSFSKFSDEFQTFSDAGEDKIYLCDACKIAINNEIIQEQSSCISCLKPKENLLEKKSIEIGNIFPLKSKFTDAGGLKVKDSNGNDVSVLMGCYGIGLGRLMGTIVEVLSDEKGIVWPESVAPFKIHLLVLNEEQKLVADNLYEELKRREVAVLYDDRDISVGEKFADADLLGMPLRVLVSNKSITAGGYEVKGRSENVSKIMSVNELYSYCHV